MAEHPGADTAPDDPVADLARRARDLRLELLTAHTTLEEDPGAVDGPRFDQLMDLTEAVLRLEQDVVDAQREADHQRDTRSILLAAALLGAGSAVALLVGVPAGWWSGWAVALLVIDLAVAVLLAAAHTAGP